MASIIPGYEYDIFISYRQNDNKYDGWVTEFINNLNKELEATIKDKINVYFDINPHDGLLETHLVSSSLENKLKCLIFVPILSRTYCDSKGFAWNNEFLAFIKVAEKDRLGLNIKLDSGNFASRVLPVRIHDLDPEDIKLVEDQLGFIRSVDFIYHSQGVNRPLRQRDDDVAQNVKQLIYRDQINKVANAIVEIMRSLKRAQVKPVEVKSPNAEIAGKNRKLAERPVRKEIIEPKQELQRDKREGGKARKFLNVRKLWIMIPGILAIIAILSVLFSLLNLHSKIKWAKEKALPDIERLGNELNFAAAFNLVQKAERYVSKEPKFKELAANVTGSLTVFTDPPGANVYVREYSDIKGKWKNLGKTPIDTLKMPRFTFYLMRIEKPGYENLVAVASASRDTLSRKLFKEGTIPESMVYIDDYWDEVKNVVIKESCGFLIDRFEVSNKQYKEFIDNGGYRKPEYWKNKFIKNGKTLTFEKAMSEFVDKTGRPGPSTWEAEDYPDGQNDYPVTGVSWYEAAAYAEYAGKNLPTLDHWNSAAGFYIPLISNYFGSKIFPISNFNGKGPESIGKYQGINYFGASDMAGNAREWCWNETPIGRVISGGGYADANYLYNSGSQLPSFDRSAQNGFRCVKYFDKGKIPESAFRQVDLGEGRDFSNEKPVPENIFSIYKNQFSYDSTDLKAVIEERDESADDWILEKISYNAAYGDERVIGYLYLPKNSSQPFQTLIFFPGMYAVVEKDLKNSSNSRPFIECILKSGRALMYPVYKGTFERNDGVTLDMRYPSKNHGYTDLLIKWVKDFSRTIDYLETRTDINSSKIGYYGHSWGGRIGGIIPAVEARLKLSILIVGGNGSARAFPEADVLNYLPRIKIPVLMLNGRYDTQMPFENTVIPFFNLIATTEKDKRLCVYETDHYVPKSEMIKETLSWLDRYLGSVK